MINNEKSASRKMCESVFRHWQINLNKHSNHNQAITEKDITAFNATLSEREIKAVTIYNYYH
jgi:hypothetical protein